MAHLHVFTLRRYASAVSVSVHPGLTSISISISQLCERLLPFLG